MSIALERNEQKALGRALTEIDDKAGHRRMMAADLFALGCLLIQDGHRVAGRKSCLTVLRSLDLPGDIRASILDKACAEPAKYFDLMAPHNEILNVFKGRTS